MVTGAECAGLVLGALPLVIEAVKAYCKGAQMLKDVILPYYRDEKLEEFYEELWWEMHILTKQIRIVLDASPGLTDQRKSELEKGLHSSDERSRSAATQAFRNFFSSNEDFEAFEQLIDKVARLVSRLIDGGHIMIRESEMSQSQLLRKLRAFVRSREGKKTSSTFKERLDLRMKEKDLRIRILNLQKWNGRLAKLIEHTERHMAGTGIVQKQTVPSVKRPSIDLSSMPRILYHGLLQCWDCSCPNRHQAQLCLRLPHQVHRALDPSGLTFELFLSVPKVSVHHTTDWAECTVHVQKQSCASTRSLNHSRVTIQVPKQPTREGIKLGKVCEAINNVHFQGHRLCLLAEEIGATPEIWRIRSQKRTLPKQTATSSTSLATILDQLKTLSLSAKRELALILAYSLVLLDGSPWLGHRWTKHELSFFQNSTNKPDYTRPYISILMHPVLHTISPQPLNLDVLHPNLSILSLGILLIEIELGKSIETLRLPEDLSNGAENNNTDYTAADRAAQTLSNSTPDYREAVLACLDPPWKTAGQPVALDDPATRKGVYEFIIAKLESEVEALGIDLMAA